MDEAKKLIAATLTNAFYAGQEPRQAFVGQDRRGEKAKPESIRDLRSPTITPKEVFEVYSRFLVMLEKK